MGRDAAVDRAYERHRRSHSKDQLEPWRSVKPGPMTRVGMWPAIFPAEQHAMILVVRAGLTPLLVERLDVHLEHGQRERVERQHVLGVLSLAIGTLRR